MNVARPVDTSEPPYHRLTPELVLDAMDGVGLRADGRMLQLNSYENRVYQVHLDDGRVVVAKFYRPARWSNEQILEEHGFARELQDAEVPVVAPLELQPPEPGANPGALSMQLLGAPATLGVAPPQVGAYRVGVTPRHGGHAPEAEDPATLRRLGRFIGRLHAVGARAPFVHRVSLEPRRIGRACVDKVIQGGHIGAAEEPAWRSTAETCLQAVAAAFDETPGLRAMRLHGDCHRGNILWRDDEGPHFVDLDDACNGPAVQDLWMLLAGDRASMGIQLGQVLAGYRSFMDFDRREIALIEPLRTLRMIHHSAWIADRWRDPAFPAAFPWFGTAAYWSQQTTQLREQLEAMAQAPIEPAFDD